MFDMEELLKPVREFQDLSVKVDAKGKELAKAVELGDFPAAHNCCIIISNLYLAIAERIEEIGKVKERMTKAMGGA